MEKWWDEVLQVGRKERKPCMPASYSPVTKLRSKRSKLLDLQVFRPGEESSSKSCDPPRVSQEENERRQLLDTDSGEYNQRPCLWGLSECTNECHLKTIVARNPCDNNARTNDRHNVPPSYVQTRVETKRTRQVLATPSDYAYVAVTAQRDEGIEFISKFSCGSLAYIRIDHRWS